MATAGRGSPRDRSSGFEFGVEAVERVTSTFHGAGNDHGRLGFGDGFPADRRPFVFCVDDVFDPERRHYVAGCAIPAGDIGVGIGSAGEPEDGRELVPGRGDLGARRLFSAFQLGDDLLALILNIVDMRQLANFPIDEVHGEACRRTPSLAAEFSLPVQSDGDV